MDKIMMAQNKHPIMMNVFLPFLTVECERVKNHIGASTGWTRLKFKEKNLIVSGGIVGGVEYLDTIQYGKNLGNGYNNYVNPFALFDILTIEGKRFFVDYYKSDIEELIEKSQKKLAFITHQKDMQERVVNELTVYFDSMREI